MVLKTQTVSLNGAQTEVEIVVTSTAELARMMYFLREFERNFGGRLQLRSTSTPRGR